MMDDATLNPQDFLEKIVGAVAAGDALALGVLFAHTGASIRSIARRWLRSPEDAEEIALDVLASVWGQADRYDSSRGSVMGWLTTMTRNKSIDRLRARKASVSFDYCGLPVTDDSRTPETELIEAQATHALKQALALLTPLRRQVVTLSFFGEQTQAEIAQFLPLPLGSVKSHSRRALLSLREHLSEEPQEDATTT